MQIKWNLGISLNKKKKKIPNKLPNLPHSLLSLWAKAQFSFFFSDVLDCTHDISTNWLWNNQICLYLTVSTDTSTHGSNSLRSCFTCHWEKVKHMYHAPWKNTTLRFNLTWESCAIRDMACRCYWHKFETYPGIWKLKVSTQKKKNCKIFSLL